MFAAAKSVLDIGGQIAAPVLGARQKENEYSKLQMDIEDAKSWLKDVKLFVDKMLKSQINLCTLPDFIDVVNAVQMFFYANYIQTSAINSGMMVQWPDWYRNELQHAMNHIQRGMNVVMSELAAYVQLASETLLEEDVTVKKIRQQLQDRQTECGAFGNWYRKQYVNKTKWNEKLQEWSPQTDWDICETCTKPNTAIPTLLQSYNDVIKSDIPANMKLMREATDSLAPLPFSDAVMKPYIEKWLPEKLRNWKNPKQANLGNDLPPSYQETSSRSSRSMKNSDYKTAFSSSLPLSIRKSMRQSFLRPLVDMSS